MGDGSKSRRMMRSNAGKASAFIVAGAFPMMCVVALMTMAPQWMPIPSEYDRSVALVRSQAMRPFPLECQGKIVLDAGVNNGIDTRIFLDKGYCVLGFDANPMMEQIVKSQSIMQQYGERLQLLTFGVDEGSGTSIFWVPLPKEMVESAKPPVGRKLAKEKTTTQQTEAEKKNEYSSKMLVSRKLATIDKRELSSASPKPVSPRAMMEQSVLEKLDPWASFDREQATRGGDPNPVPIQVPIIRCEAIWSLLTSRLYYAKIDIEERHYLCIEALSHLKPDQLPRYISWEMHERAKGLSFPMLDVQLIMQLNRLGYLTIKIDRKSQEIGSADKSSDDMPEDILDSMSGNKDWVPVEDMLKRGLGDPARMGAWLDYYMKLAVA